MRRTKLWTLHLTIAGLAFIACNSGIRTQQVSDLPDNLSITIDGGAEVTRDTLLRVDITGDNVEVMQIGTTPNLEDAGWEAFDTIKIVHAPMEEGLFEVFGRFASAGGSTTGVLSDNITLDFTARVFSLDVSGSDSPLHAGDAVEFRMETGEAGIGRVRFGSFTAHYRLNPIGEGVFTRSLTLPHGVSDSLIHTYGYFIDIAGNISDQFEADTVLVFEGNALEPRLLGKVEIEELLGFDIWYHRGFCFVSDFNHALQLIDVRRIDEPIYEGSIDLAGWGFGMDASEDFLLVADSHRNGGWLSIFAITNPQFTARLGRIHLTGQPRDVLLDDDIAYVACYTSGLQIFEIDEPRAPLLIATVPINGFGEFVCKADTIIFIGGMGGMAAVNVRIPEEPELLSEFPIHDQPEAMVYHEGNLLIATRVENVGLMVIDVSDPREFVFHSREPSLAPATGLLLMAPFLYIAQDSRISVVDIGDIESMQVLHRLSGLAGARGMVFDDRYLYVAGAGEMAIVDLFDE